MSSPISVRFSKAQWAEIEREAARINYSANQFIQMGLRGIVEMIETPDGQPMKEPEVVALARFVRKPMIGAVATRKG